MQPPEAGSDATEPHPAAGAPLPEEAPAAHLARIGRVLAEAGVEADPAELLAAIRDAAVVTVNFHAGRLLDDGRSVAQVLSEDGVFESRFDVPLTPGGLPAFPGGDHDRWRAGPRRQGAARTEPDPAVTYGGLDLLEQQNGACPRFGASHLRLRPAVLERVAISYGASEPATDAAGGLAAAVAGVLESVAATSCLLGRDGVDVASFARVTLGREPRRPDGPFAPAMGYSLDDYIEARIPGPVDLGADGEAVVIDPAYAGTPTADALLAAARRHGLRVMWHPGCVLPVARIPTTAPRAPGARLTVWQAFCAHGRARRLAERVAAESGQRDDGRQFVDAAVINTAAAATIRDPEAWRSWGEPPEILSSLKHLWLLVVVYGRPPGAGP